MKPGQAADVRVVPAERFGSSAAEALVEALGRFREPVVGLATGNTPIPLYEELRRRVEAGMLDLSGIRPFAIDEHGGTQGHPCSNRAFFARHWESIPGARGVVQFEPNAPDYQREAERFAAALAAAGGLDIAVLGIGLNGHLAFNEPGTTDAQHAGYVPLAAETRESAAGCWGAETPTYGLTLGLAELLAAREVLLLANRAAKAAIVVRALRGPIGPECPASYLQRHSRLTVILDEAAASGLGASTTPGESG